MLYLIYLEAKHPWMHSCWYCSFGCKGCQKYWGKQTMGAVCHGWSFVPQKLRESTFLEVTWQTLKYSAALNKNWKTFFLKTSFLTWLNFVLCSRLLSFFSSPCLMKAPRPSQLSRNLLLCCVSAALSSPPVCFSYKRASGRRVTNPQSCRTERQ